MKPIVLIGAAAVAVGAVIYLRRNPSTAAGKATLQGTIDGRAFADSDLFSEKYANSRLPKFSTPPVPSAQDLLEDFGKGAAAGGLACAAAGPLAIGCAFAGGVVSVAPQLHGFTSTCFDSDGIPVPCVCPKAPRPSCRVTEKAVYTDCKKNLYTCEPRT